MLLSILSYNADAVAFQLWRHMENPDGKWRTSTPTKGRAMGGSRLLFVALLFVVLANSVPAQAQDRELATKLANPISSLISVPFQYNLDCCYGLSRGYHTTLNIQPVVPFRLNDEWSLIVLT
jgi:hypothetical protein